MLKRLLWCTGVSLILLIAPNHASALTCLSGHSPSEDALFAFEAEEAMHKALEDSGRAETVSIYAANVPDLCFVESREGKTLYYSRRWLWGLLAQPGWSEASLPPLITSVLGSTPSPAHTQTHPAAQHACAPRVVEPTFKTVAQTVVVEEPSESLQIVPATFRTVPETIITVEAHHQGDQLRTSNETVLVEEPHDRLEVIPTTYKTVSETFVVQSASERLRLIGNKSHAIAVPAQTRTVQRRVVATPAGIRRVRVPGRTSTVQRRVVSQSTVMARSSLQGRP